MIEDLLGSKSKVSILRQLIADSHREYTIKEIGKMTNLSMGTVFPALRYLINTRIILSRKVGKSQLYSINERHPLFKEIKTIFIKEGALAIDIAKEFANLVPKQKIKNLILFGSAARGEFKEGSDIDLLIIYDGEKPALAIEKTIDTLMEKYDVNVVPTFLSIKEVQRRKQEVDSFIITAISEGKFLYGDRKWLES